MKKISLESLGLVTVETAAAMLKRSPRQIQKWIDADELPAAPIGTGQRTIAYILRRRDVLAYKPRPRGRPTSGRKDK